MTQPIRIANCSGFFGDRFSGAREMVEGGPIDVLTGDWLAELTMLILSRAQAKHPNRGFAHTFVAQMEEVMGTCLDRGIKVVSNAGGLDPAGCAEAVEAVADRLGLSLTVAYVDGDDLMPAVADLIGSGTVRTFDERTELGDHRRYLTANAYLGCWGIVDALGRGADIVVTGRVTDAALACGPAAWHHDWAQDDWDALAGGVVAGHVLECSAQATGGNYSFFTEIEDLETSPRFGFPWAEVAADGSSIIGKHDGTGGEVSVGTVTSQLLYEIGSPRYLGPDVVARFDTVQLEQVEKDRVSISAVSGEPPPSTLKVGINEFGGYRNSFEIALTGLQIEEKAALAAAAFWDACPHDPSEFESVRSEVIHTASDDPRANNDATAVWRLVVRDSEESKVGRAFSNAATETVLSSIPGMYPLSGGPAPAQPFGIFRPALIDADAVPQFVHMGGEVFEVRPPTSADREHSHDSASSAQQSPAPSETVRAPLGTLVGTRSGDKGGDANLGVFTRSGAAHRWLAGFLTVGRLKELLPELADLEVERHDFPNLLAVNFVIRGLLDEGVAASTRRDAQAKSLGEWLRARVVDIPIGIA